MKEKMMKMEQMLEEKTKPQEKPVAKGKFKV